MLHCDVCGCKLVMNAGGNTATCEFCGMEYSMERIREKAQALQSNGATSNRQVSTGEDVARLKSLLRKYMASFDYVEALKIANRMLEASPNDYETNKIYDNLQELQYFEVKNEVLVKYSGQAKNIVIPDGIKIIGDSAFEGSKIESVIIPDSVVEIGNYAFYNSNLSQIVLGQNIQKIGFCAFEGTEIKEIIIPDSVIEVGGCAFENCRSLSKVILGKGIKQIQECMFQHCVTMKEFVIPDYIVEIGYQSFNECENLQKVVLGKGLKKIDSKAFCGTAVKEIIIPEAIKHITIGDWIGCEVKYEKDIKEAEKKRQKELEEAEKRRKQELEAAEKRRKQQEIRRSRIEAGVCSYCGGSFKGIFIKKCSVCGLKKDY